MVFDNSEQGVIAALEDFFTKRADYYYYPEVLRVATLYPDEKSVEVNYADLSHCNSELAEYALDHPSSFIYCARMAMSRVLPADLTGRMLNVRLVKLPDDGEAETVRVPIKKIRLRHQDKMISVKGLVNKVTQVHQRMKVGSFLCMSCGTAIQVQQRDLKVEECTYCDPDQGGCGKGANKTSFYLLTTESLDGVGESFGRAGMKLSEFTNFQKMSLQELPETLKGIEKPQQIVVVMEDDLAGKVISGDRVIINGVMQRVPKEKGTKTITEFTNQLYAHSIEVIGNTKQVIVLPNEEQQIKMLSGSPSLYEDIVASIAPSIHGYGIEKMALAMQVFGGYEMILDDGSKFRGDIHILLCGDPGCGKSQLLLFMARLAPRGVYVVGKTASPAGLLAACIQDTSLGESQWVLESGAMVQAHEGMCAIDEMDKMSEQDTNAFHEALEQQTVTIAKVISAVLPCKTTLLAAANPKMSRFNDSQPYVLQIKMPPSLMSRFDCIFPITDKPNKKEDRTIGSHILRNIQSASLKVRASKMKEEETLSVKPDVENTAKPKIPLELLRKYIAYARENVFPAVTNETVNMIVDYYADVRSKNQSAVPLNARQLGAMVRLATASARMRLSSTVDQDDAARALNIMTYWLKKAATDSDGNVIDIDIIETGTSESQRFRMINILSLVRDLSSGGNAATSEDIIAHAGRIGIQPDRVVETLKRLKTEGRIYEPKTDNWKTVD